MIYLLLLKQSKHFNIKQLHKINCLRKLIHNGGELFSNVVMRRISDSTFNTQFQQEIFINAKYLYKYYVK